MTFVTNSRLIRKRVGRRREEIDKTKEKEENTEKKRRGR
jgi:hypothetical protein